MKARLIATDRIAAETAGFTFEVSAPFTFEAGQTCDITIPSPLHEDQKGSTRTFSIASSPADLPRVLVATRLTGSAFKRSLLEARAGLEVDLNGPFGSFVLHKNARTPAVFLAGGIGITPFRSMIKDATERRLPHWLTLLYSNRTLGSTAFLSDLEAWRRENAHLAFIPSLTQPADPGQWPYETGMFDASFIKRHVERSAKAIYYIAGPLAFVNAMRSALAQLEADPDDIRTEEFPGY